jgi:hypothetical protein
MRGRLCADHLAGATHQGIPVASSRLPGPLCRVLGALEIDTGTLCLTQSPAPGSIGSSLAAAKAISSAKTKPPRVYQEHRGAVKDPFSYVGQDVYLNDSGSPQCAELVKQLAKAPRTGEDNWQRGTMLTEANVTTIEIGTPIATGWNDRGFYPHNSTGQHAGIFSGAVSNAKGKVLGFTIVEQYSGLDEVISRTVYFDPTASGKKDTYFYRGADYATIKW